MIISTGTSAISRAAKVCLGRKGLVSLIALSAVALACAPTLSFAAQKTKAAAEVLPLVTPEGPLLVVVSLKAQQLTVYDKNGRVLETPVSSGQVGHETPEGVFSIIERNREHFSNLYNDAPMPNMQRITWSGVAMHAGNLPGYPASHGCIRMPMSVSARMFDLTKLGTRVVVTHDKVVPVALEHPNLFKPLESLPLVTVAAASPPANPASRSDSGMTPPMMLGASIPTAALPMAPGIVSGRPAGISRAQWAAELLKQAQAKEAAARTATLQLVSATREAKKAMTQALISERNRSALAAQVASLSAALKRGLNPSAAAKAEAAKAVAEAKLTASVVETDRLRASHEEKRAIADQLARDAASAAKEREEAGAAARAASRSLKPVSVFVSRKTGRLYVRQGFQPLFDVPVEIEGKGPVGTHVFTALEEKAGGEAMTWSAVTIVGGPAPISQPSSKRNRNAQAEPQRPVYTASAALDRIKIPEDVRQRIGLMMMPGSSLIVSDNGISQETGQGTDFVILTKDTSVKQAW